MKIILVAFAVFLFTSCSKNDMNLSNLDLSIHLGTIPEDSNNKVKADVDMGGNITHLSTKGFGAGYSRYLMPLFDSSSVVISASDSSTSLQLHLINILAPGTYNFGPNPGRSKEIKAYCYINNTSFNNAANITSGTIKIDVFTAQKIEGTFSVTCWNGTQSVIITNGTFTGNF